MSLPHQTSASVIKRFEMDGLKFVVMNVVTHAKYTHFVVYLDEGGRLTAEYIRIVADPGMAWADVMSFITTRAGADERINKFLAKLKGEK